MKAFDIYFSPGAFYCREMELFGWKNFAIFSTAYESSAFVPYNPSWIIHGVKL